jgi:hypothetical protein
VDSARAGQGTSVFDGGEVAVSDNIEGGDVWVGLLAWLVGVREDVEDFGLANGSNVGAVEMVLVGGEYWVSRMRGSRSAVSLHTCSRSESSLRRARQQRQRPELFKTPNGRP